MSVPYAIVGSTKQFDKAPISNNFPCISNNRASDRPQKKKSNFAGFLGTNSRKNRLISREFCGSFWANFTKKQSVKNGRICVIFKANFA